VSGPREGREAGAVTRKHFTVVEANQTLPRLVRLMHALQHKLQWMSAHQPGGRPMSEHNIVNEGPVEPNYFRSLVTVRSIVKDVESMGVQIKDARNGLVDFPSRLYGRDVLLCWKLGESKVRFWHDPDSGYAGRQPLPDIETKESDADEGN
jgi:hypothetical protein